MSNQQLSRCDMLRSVGAGAIMLSVGNLFSQVQAQEVTSNMMTLTVNGVDVHYETRGEGRPLLILHGYPLDHEVMLGAFEPVFENRSGYQRIYPDMPGMGMSPANEQVKNSDDILRVMTDFMAELIDDNYLVAGFSYGGYIAQGMVMQNPELIDGAMFMAPVVSPDDANRDIPDPVVLVTDPEAVEMVPEAARPLILGTTVVQTKPVIGRILNEFGNSLGRGNAEFIAQLRQPENYGLSFDVRDIETPYEKPTLILTGRQDSVVGYAEAFTVARQYPRATYATLDRGGHGLYIEQDALFEVLTHEWLDRVEESL